MQKICMLSYVTPPNNLSQPPDSTHQPVSDPKKHFLLASGQILILVNQSVLYSVLLLVLFFTLNQRDRILKTERI